jgi:hypothetical protein
MERLTLHVPKPLFVTNGSSGMEISGTPTTAETGGFGSNGGESAAVLQSYGAHSSRVVLSTSR